MASATVTQGHPLTVAVTSTISVITKAAGQRGKVYNASAVTMYIGTNDGATVTATDATQEAYKIVLLAGHQVVIPRGVTKFSLKANGGDTGAAVWLPEEPDA